LTRESVRAIIGSVKRRKKNPQIREIFNPQISQIYTDLRRRFFTKEVLIVSGLLLLAFILRLVYLSHLKANDPNFYQPAPGTDMLTYHNSAQQIVNGTFGKGAFNAIINSITKARENSIAENVK